MSTELETRAPRMRCYECGSTEIASVCHHCARAMCATDSPAILTDAGRPVSHEFDGLELDQSAAHHCADCHHVVKGRLGRLIVAAAVAAVLGLVLLTGPTVGLGVLVTVVAVAAAVAAVLVDRTRAPHRLPDRPPVPLVPNVQSIHLVETLRGVLRLDPAGKYHTSAAPVAGSLTVAMTFGRPDRDRLDRYRRTYRLTPADDIEYSAGFVALRGPAGLRFADADVRGNVLPLRGRIRDLPFFGGPQEHRSGQWSVRLEHELLVPLQADELPIWLTPSLVPESDQRTLELELQWARFGSPQKPLPVDRIELLSIDVPIAWGNVENATISWANMDDGATNRATVRTEERGTGDDDVVRVIEWMQLAVKDPTGAAGTATVDSAGRPARRLKLSVRFENRIVLTDTVRGRLAVAFKGALSGVAGLTLYHPLGGRRPERIEKSVRTRLNAGFELSLAGIRYQDVRVVPDRKLPADRDKPASDEFAGVIPDDATMTDLTNAMSDQGYYVKRVIENPPRSGGRANVVNRIWDVAGRRYDGVYPVDFHLVLTGEEIGRGDIRAQTGNAKVHLTVQGAYASADMEKRIVREWERLHGLTVDTLRSRPAAPPAEPVIDPDGVGPPVGERPRGGGGDPRRRRLAELDDAFVRGDIPEDLYREIKGRLEQDDPDY
jgi:hypothetical protein